MESSTFVIALLGGPLIGAGFAWLFLRGAAARLRADLCAGQAVERARADELAEARREGEAWRAKFGSEQFERARFETEARRVPELDAELQKNRSRAEARPSRNRRSKPRPVGFGVWKPELASSAVRHRT